MNRLWSRVGVRATSVGLLLTGVAGGVYLGQGKQVQQQSVDARLVVQADAAEIDLLKERSAEHAAARAPQRKAEAEAAEKAATEAKAAAGRARKLEKAAIAKKAADLKDAKDAAAAKKRQAAASAAGGGSGESKPYDGPIPASCGDYSGNRAVGCALMLDAGFDLDQMPCLDKLWKKESGWNTKAANRGSGAYGIPQALPGSKMASIGADWRTSAATQIKWGLGYISGRYNSPCGAWSHSQNTGWY